MNLTIAYITARHDPRSTWFFASLAREVSTLGCPLPDVVVVDSYYAPNRVPHGAGYCGPIRNVAPKPSPWQGEHRLTKQDWFAASNARNTALCYAQDGYIAYVDDLSVLMPGWLSCVQEAMSGGYIACGSYKKVKKLHVESNGLVSNYEEFEAGNDNRRYCTTGNEPRDCAGNWLYGCSVAMPVEALLKINGWPEICDGLGFEDVCCGIVLESAGYKFRYDPRMLTLESEEHHHVEPAFRREDWHFANGVVCLGGNGATDKSHAALAIAQQSKWFPNYCDFTALRQHILAGGTFPTGVQPQHDWYTHKALCDL